MIRMLDRVDYPIRTILCPISLREEDPSWAFQAASSLAQQHDAELILLHVLSADAVHHDQAQRNAQARRLEELRERGSLLNLTTTIVWGEPASAIVRRARESGCDLIVMRPSRARWLIGRVVDTVSQRVCRLAHCPVILVNQEISGRVERIRKAQRKEPSYAHRDSNSPPLTSSPTKGRNRTLFATGAEPAAAPTVECGAIPVAGPHLWERH